MFCDTNENSSKIAIMEFDKDFLGKSFEQVIKNPRLCQNFDLCTSQQIPDSMLNTLLLGMVVPILRHEDILGMVICLCGKIV